MAFSRPTFAAGVILARSIRSGPITFDFHGLLHRKIFRLFAFENSAGVDANLTRRFGKAAAVTHQAASGSELAKLGNRRHLMASGQYAELLGPTDEKCVRSNYERANTQLRQCRENRIEITVITGMQNMEL